MLLAKSISNLVIIFCWLGTLALCKAESLFDIRRTALPASCEQTRVPESCAEATACTKQSGYYALRNPEYSMETFVAYCDAVTDGGGWTVVQLRKSGSEDFYRGWTDYEKGFGAVDSNFFIGLEKLYAFIKQMGPLELYIAFQQEYDSTIYAKYDNFVIGSASESYRLKDLGRYTGTTQDSLSPHLGEMFSTKDRNDKNCATIFKSAWWYINCLVSDLNGPYGEIQWGSIAKINFVKMMVRRRQYTDDCTANTYSKVCNPDVYPSNCIEAIACTHTSGINIINQPGFLPYIAHCDADKDGGDWLVIQSRQEHTVDFARTWADYEIGFGDVLTGEFFIGLNKLYSMGPQELYIELTDKNGRIAYAKYDNFVIGNAAEQYAIKSMGKYTGTAGNALGDQMFLPFSTIDKNSAGCAAQRQGGWWYSFCGISDLNGEITWSGFGVPYPEKTRMMVRPRRFSDDCKRNV